MTPGTGHLLVVKKKQEINIVRAEFLILKRGAFCILVKYMKTAEYILFQHIAQHDVPRLTLIVGMRGGRSTKYVVRDISTFSPLG